MNYSALAGVTIIFEGYCRVSQCAVEQGLPPLPSHAPASNPSMDGRPTLTKATTGARSVGASAVFAAGGAFSSR